MKFFRSILIIGFAIFSAHVHAQSNTFPGTGNVGIGTTVPQKLFEVNTAPNSFVSVASNLIIGQFSGLHFGYLEEGHNLYRKSALVFERLDNAARGRIHILNNAGFDGSSATLNDSRLTINYDGKVGIGTTAPVKLLDVKGPARFSTAEDAINEIQIGSTSNGFNGGAVAFLGAGGGAIGKIQSTYAENPNRGVISFQQLNIGDAWKEVMRIDGENVGIGTNAPADRLSVNGRVRAKEVKVEASNWPDYVFKDNYELLSISETEKFIKMYNHLPGIPSAKEVEKTGIDLGEMDSKLLKKVEELTLYIIELNSKQQQRDLYYNELVENLNNKLNKQQKELEQLKQTR